MKKLLLGFVFLALGILSQAQDNPAGFISIDCGAPNGYTDETLGIEYTTDEGYVESGVNMQILPKYFSQFTVNHSQLSNIRVFPKGTRNCYTVRPQQADKNNRYLIRATFAYGNYDNKFQTPSFALYIDVNLWAKIYDPTNYTYDEIIYTPTRDYIQICLVNLGTGIPFISALELRPLLDDTMYAVPSSIALRNWWRFNIGSSDQLLYRYPQDDYDRIWEGRTNENRVTITANRTDIDVLNRNRKASPYKVPLEVLMTAQQSLNGSYGMLLYWSSNSSYSWYVYLHFVELQTLEPGQFRQFVVEVNDDTVITTITPPFLKPLTVPTVPFSGDVVNYSVTPTDSSNVSSFINAAEIFRTIDLKISPTDLNDANAMFAIKKSYKVVKESWQGDPCAPKEFAWIGLTCSSDNFPRILSLNLSSSGLEGNITDYFFNLTALTSLDLSSNQLTGQIPEYFAQMSNLKIINLSNNTLTGPIPPALQQRVDNKTLTLSIFGNPICQNQNQTENCSPLSPPPTKPCCAKKSSIVIPVAAAVGSVFGVILIVFALFILRRNKNKRNKAKEERVIPDQLNNEPKLASRTENVTESSYGDGFKGEVHPKLVAKNRPFTSEEVISITRNFSVVIGEGGFGKVYHGTLSNGHQVAIKVLSQSSKQGYKEFQAEAQLLMVVHHRNLVSLVGYCEDSETMALLYEYMPNGDLRKYLAGRGVSVLSWSQRLQIAVDAAQGLDYLHNGCTPSIIHRDLKTSNILLDENMRAKIADFGLSRIFASDSGGNQISSTRPAGTPGYIDPVFNSSGSLNKKSDVYSFGIILFELITGQPAIMRNSQSSTHIVKWTTSLIEGGDIHKIIDPSIQGQFNAGSAWKAIEIAMQCVQMLPNQRPNMNHVLSELSQCLSMENGPVPRRNQREEGISLASSTSFDMTSLELDIGHMAPRAR